MNYRHCKNGLKTKLVTEGMIMFKQVNHRTPQPSICNPNAVDSEFTRHL